MVWYMMLLQVTEFDHGIPDSSNTHYNDACRHRVYKAPNVRFRFARYVRQLLNNTSVSPYATTRSPCSNVVKKLNDKTNPGNNGNLLMDLFTVKVYH